MVGVILMQKFRSFLNLGGNVKPVARGFGPSFFFF